VIASVPFLDRLRELGIESVGWADEGNGIVTQIYNIPSPPTYTALHTVWNRHVRGAGSPKSMSLSRADYWSVLSFLNLDQRVPAVQGAPLTEGILFESGTLRPGTHQRDGTLHVTIHRHGGLDNACCTT
jgi:hypothetical protein